MRALGSIGCEVNPLCSQATLGEQLAQLTVLAQEAGVPVRLVALRHLVRVLSRHRQDLTHLVTARWRCLQ